MARKHLSKEERLKIYHMHDGCCAYCGKKLELKDMQVDHIVPVYKDGANDIENYLPACRACNFYKGAMSVEKFRENLKGIPKRLEKLFIFRLAEQYGLVKVNDKRIYFVFEQDDAINGNRR